MIEPTTESRKSDHLALCAAADVSFREKTTLLEQVDLAHEAVPSVDFDAADSSCELFGRKLDAPLLITAISGGVPRGDALNAALAIAAAGAGIGLGVGSQRLMLEGGKPWPRLRSECGKGLLLLGNIGVAQVRSYEPARIADLAAAIEADALCVHLNAAQEAVQPEGDRDFTGAMDAIKKLCSASTVPIVLKETGCGISAATARRAFEAGVRHLDVAGAGGTSWVAVELLRRGGPPGWRDDFREWGIPTAASVCAVSGLGFETVVASGGIRSGLDAAKAVALGADAAGFALPALRAFETGGAEAVSRLAADYVSGFRLAMSLCGAAGVRDLKGRAVLKGQGIREWLESDAAGI